MAKKQTPRKKTTPGEADSKIERDAFLIVGIGASAGGLESCKEFFEEMGDKPEMAFIIVQHLDPTHKSLLAEILSHHTKMKVTEVMDGTVIMANHVYVIPPNKYMAIFGGKLHLLEPQDDRAFRRPIDFFLKSLAADQKENAVGMIFSGTGTEGTISLKIIKGEGGLTIVQDPDTAKYDGMPRSVVNAGVADFVLPVKKIPEQLLNYAKTKKIPSIKIAEQNVLPSNLLEKIFILLRKESGCNFSNYKDSTVIRRIEKRMIINQVEKLEDYVTFLQKNSTEILALFQDLLIGVTHFFRDQEAFKALENKAIKTIIEKKSKGDTIRIWIPGCSTGEEAYSLAILFDEALKVNNLKVKVQIFASDLDENAIKFARMGLYPESIAADVNKTRLKKYFQHDGAAYRIRKEIRDQIIFAQQNVISDPPFSKLDMISCRNLLIYLKPKTQQRVFSIFHYSLNPDGILFLGNSESLGDSVDLFTTFDRKHKIFIRKNVVLEVRPEIGFKLTEPILPKKSMADEIFSRQKDHLKGIVEKILLTKYAPPCVIINKKGDAIYFSGETGKYLQPPAGMASLMLVEMAKEGLKTDLRSLITKAQKSKSHESKLNVKVKTNDHIETVDLFATPLSQFEPTENFLMITFEKNKKTKEVVEKKKAVVSEDPSEISALEQELSSTKEYLRSTIEELEISNEELKSTNEELQSSNEELQSTNEELETSKEELQSVNEEMITVNGELQSKIDELGHAYNDMNNLLSSTKIGTIFLDNQLNIRRFTPSTSQIINLIQSDIGRPISDLVSNLEYDEYAVDSKKVLEELTPLKQIVKSKKGAWYQMQIVPYRTSENVIDGVVLTFVDITEEREQQEKLTMSQNRYQELLKNTKTFIYKQDRTLKFTEVFNPVMGVKPKELLGKTDSVVMNNTEATRLKEIKRKVFKNGITKQVEIETLFNDKINYYDLTIRPVINDKNEVVEIACTATDITDLKKAQNEISELKSKK